MRRRKRAKEVKADLLHCRNELMKTRIEYNQEKLSTRDRQ